MTVFAAIRGLTFLARDVFGAALYLIPAPGLSGYDVDSADELAEREAAVDVTEPNAADQLVEATEELGLYDDDPMVPDSFFRSSAELEDDCCLGGDFPAAADDAPAPPDHPSYPQTNGLNTESQQERDDLVKKLTKQAYWSSPWMKHYQTADSQRLDKITVLLEDIRNLLQHNAPVASASSPTPADATGPDPAAADCCQMQRMFDGYRRRS